MVIVTIPDINSMVFVMLIGISSYLSVIILLRPPFSKNYTYDDGKYHHIQKFASAISFIQLSQYTFRLHTYHLTMDCSYNHYNYPNKP